MLKWTHNRPDSSRAQVVPHVGLLLSVRVRYSSTALRSVPDSSSAAELSASSSLRASLPDDLAVRFPQVWLCEPLPMKKTEPSSRLLPKKDSWSELVVVVVVGGVCGRREVLLLLRMLGRHRSALGCPRVLGGSWCPAPIFGLLLLGIPRVEWPRFWCLSRARLRARRVFTEFSTLYDGVHEVEEPLKGYCSIRHHRKIEHDSKSLETTSHLTIFPSLR
jgi:hypothetical protein